MRRWLAIILLAVPTPAWAAGLTVNSAHFYWQWEPVAGQPIASEFRVKCGSSAGVYPDVDVIHDPAARSYPVKPQVPDGNATYHCVVTAANDVGESAPTNEVVLVRKGQRLEIQ